MAWSTAKPSLPSSGLPSVELGAAQARDAGRWHPLKTVMRYLAGHQVGLVQRRAGDQHVGVFGTGIAQHRRLDAVAHHTTQVHAVLQRGQALRVGVDDGDVVLLRHQALGDALAHTAGAEDQDLHGAGLWAGGSGGYSRASTSCASASSRGCKAVASSRWSSRSRHSSASSARRGCRACATTPRQCGGASPAAQSPRPRPKCATAR